MLAVVFFALFVGCGDGFVLAPPERTSKRKALGNDVFSDIGTSLFVASAGVVVLFGAGSLIVGAYEGEKGLGAFLRDGEGYQKSGYKDDKLEPRRMKAPDFLDKLSLPNFDFVQVYSAEENAVEQAENLRRELSETLATGDTDKAALIERRLEKVMRDNGLRYEGDREEEFDSSK